MKIALIVFCIGVSLGMAGQSAAQANASASVSTMAPPETSVLRPLLAQLDETARTTSLDIAHLRIDKWKTDANSKKQAQDNADSVTRNVTKALPGMEEQVRTNPQSLAAAFKLYRNVIALYDVFSGLTESAGAFGSKAEFDALAKDAENLDRLRRTIGDTLENLTAARDAEVIRLRTEVAQPKAVPVESPQKIVVDEQEKPQKPVRKKPAKPAAKPSNDNSTTQNAPPSSAPPKQ